MIQSLTMIQFLNHLKIKLYMLFNSNISFTAIHREQRTYIVLFIILNNRIWGINLSFVKLLTCCDTGVFAHLDLWYFLLVI